MYVIFSFLALYMHTGDHGKHVLSSRYIHKCKHTIEDMCKHRAHSILRCVLYIIIIVGIVLYYLCICVYLYGDLAIYAVSIPKSMRTVLW